MGWADAVIHWKAAFANKEETVKLTGTALTKMTTQADEEMVDNMMVARNNLINVSRQISLSPKLLPTATLVSLP